MIDIERAIKLKQDGLSLRTIMEMLNVEDLTYKGFQKKLWRYENKPSENENLSIDVKAELLKILNKGNTLQAISESLNESERVVGAYIEDFIENGYNIVETDGEYKILKAVIPGENNHFEEWEGEKVIRFGVVSDTHLCNKWQQLTFLNHLYDIFEAEGITTVYHAGDISDGFYKNRPSHIYELIDGLAGADRQADYIISNYPERKGITTKYISGNHDSTHIMNGGANIGKMIAKERKDMIYLGMDNAKVHLTPNCILEVNHPIDGAAYALSYTLQKLIDSMMGGEKPNVLLNGHHHKAMYLFYRNIHSFEAGTIEAQTPFMKGKKLAAMVGGYIIEVYVDSEGTITRCKNEFIPLYKPIENDY